MAGQHAINQAALNGGTAVALSAAAAFAAGAVLAADITYNWKSYSDATATGLLESLSYQTHAASGANTALCAFYSDNIVYKPGGSALPGVATFAAIAAPLPGGCSFDAEATMAAGITIKQRATGAFSAEATTDDNDDYWVVRTGAGQGIFAPGHFHAEPGVLLSGETDYTWDATWYPKATAGIAVSDVRILADGWFAFGGAEVNAPLTTKQRTASSFQLATAQISTTPIQWHVASSAFSASASAVANQTRTAYVAANLPAFATAQFYGKGLKISQASFSAPGQFAAEGTRIVFHGYPVLAATAALLANGVHYHHSTSALFSAADVSMEAAVNIVSEDVVTFLRPAEQRDFSRPFEVTLFTRSPS